MLGELSWFRRWKRVLTPHTTRRCSSDRVAGKQKIIDEVFDQKMRRKQKIMDKPLITSAQKAKDERTSLSSPERELNIS